jgi:hypothetical protein
VEQVGVKNRPVRECWWEDMDFHIIYDDTGEHVQFKNAWFESCENKYDSDIVSEEQMTYVEDAKEKDE